MGKFVFLAALFALVAAMPAIADERTLTGREIREALAGNTVDGVWGKMRYRQYSGDDGLTIYIAEDKPATRGKWWTTTGSYCSS